MRDCNTCFFVGECRIFYRKEYYGIDCPAWVKDKDEWLRRNRLCSEYANRQKRRVLSAKMDATVKKGDSDD